MSEFLLLFRGGDDAMAAMSPEQAQAHMQLWFQWIGGLAEQDRVISSEPLAPTGRTVTGPAKVVTDGPFLEGKEMVGGYLLFKAASMDEATAIAQDCPVLLADDGSVEVREVVKL